MTDSATLRTGASRLRARVDHASLTRRAAAKTSAAGDVFSNSIRATMAGRKNLAGLPDLPSG
jgi:hypothetical protein